jgi:hypothetical protein
MRTTLSLEQDVAAQLERLRQRDGRSFKDLVNTALRVGLAQLDGDKPKSSGPFTQPMSLGRSRLPSLDDVSEALVFAEGEDYR